MGWNVGLSSPHTERLCSAISTLGVWNSQFLTDSVVGHELWQWKMSTPCHRLVEARRIPTLGSGQPAPHVNRPQPVCNHALARARASHWCQLRLLISDIGNFRLFLFTSCTVTLNMLITSYHHLHCNRRTRRRCVCFAFLLPVNTSKKDNHMNKYKL